MRSERAPAPSTPAAAPAAGPGPVPIPVKIVVAGGFGAGKTTLVGAISEIEPVTTEAVMTSYGAAADEGLDLLPEKSSTTVAMDFGRVTVDGDIVLYLFGTPGQDRFGFMWDDISDGALGAVVVADSRRLGAAFPAVDYFEDRELPFVVAVNRFDGVLHHDLDDVRTALDVDPDVPVLAADLRRRADVKDTVLSLLEVVLARALAEPAPPDPGAPDGVPVDDTAPPRGR